MGCLPLSRRCGYEFILRATLFWMGFLLGASSDKVAESRETVGASCLRLEVSGVRCVKVGRYDVDESM